jgi:hypothetical protein
MIKPKPAKTFSTKSAEIFRSMGDDSSTSFNDFYVDGCNISEVILFLQKLALSPNASSMNVAFTKHITNALMKIREEKLKQEVSIPKKLEDGWELMTHKYRGCTVVFSINKSVEPNEEQKVLTSGFDQGFTVNTSKHVFRSLVMK